MANPLMYNAEKYYDPTAGAALIKVTKQEKIRKGEGKMKFAYIASPCRAYGSLTVADNIKRANRYCRFASQSGFVPVCPHAYFAGFLDDGEPDERNAGMYMGLQLLRRCEEIWVFGSRISAGMNREIKAAKARHIPVRYFDNQCRKVNRCE
jgi:hypothetical protein